MGLFFVPFVHGHGLFMIFIALTDFHDCPYFFNDFQDFHYFFTDFQDVQYFFTNFRIFKYCPYTRV